MQARVHETLVIIRPVTVNFVPQQTFRQSCDARDLYAFSHAHLSSAPERSPAEREREAERVRARERERKKER